MVLTTWLGAHPCTKSVPSRDNSNLWVQVLCNANAKTSSERAPQWDCNFTTRQFSCTMIWEQHMNRPGRFSPCLSIMNFFLFYWDSRILGLTEAELHFFLLSQNSYSELQILAHLVASEHGKLFHKKSLSLTLNQRVSHPVASWTHLGKGKHCLFPDGSLLTYHGNSPSSPSQAGTGFQKVLERFVTQYKVWLCNLPQGLGQWHFLDSPWCPSSVPTASWPGPGEAEHMACICWHTFSLAWENLCQTQKYSQQSDLFGYILWRSQIRQYFGRGKLNSWKHCKKREREGACSTTPERGVGHKQLDRDNLE